MKVQIFPIWMQILPNICTSKVNICTVKYFERPIKMQKNSCVRPTTNKLLNQRAPSAFNQQRQQQPSTNNRTIIIHHALFARTALREPQTGTIMKFKVKEVARHLIQNEDVNMPLFLKLQLAEQLLSKSKRLPGALRNWIAKKIFPSAQNEEEPLPSPLNEESAPTALPNGKVKKTRRQNILSVRNGLIYRVYLIATNY